MQVVLPFSCPDWSGNDFADEVKKFNPNREDINTWFDVLDLDDYCSFGCKA
jgi:hypothetical protein